MVIVDVPMDHKLFQEEFECSLDITNFIYKELSFRFIDGNGDIYVNVFIDDEKQGDIEKITISLVKLGDYFLYPKHVFYQARYNSDNECGFEVLCNVDERKYTDIGYDLVTICFRTMAYIMSAPRNRVEKIKTNKKSDEEKTKKTKIQKSKGLDIFLLDDLVEYVNEQWVCDGNKNTYKIKCPCWTVRGHYRHYKNGKTVFIKDFKKGKSKDATKPKDKKYKI